MLDRAAAFAATGFALLVGHTVGDHIAQTDYQAANKAKTDHDDNCQPGCPIDHPATSWRAMAGHVGGYTATCAAVLAVVHAATGVRPSWRRVLAGHAFSAATHALIDRRWPVQCLLRATRSPHFAQMQTPINGPYEADQSLHHACLLVAALIMTGGCRG